MARALEYCVRPDPDGRGWIVAAEGYTAHSLPYDTLEQAISFAEALAREHPGSTLAVTNEPPALTPTEIEHRIAA